MSFSFLVPFTHKLRISKIGSLIIGDKVNHNFRIIRCLFILQLLNTSFDNNIHIIFKITLFVDLLPLLNGEELYMLINFISFLWIELFVHLLRTRKNLLKASILSNFYRFLLPGAFLSSLYMLWMFYKDWTERFCRSLFMFAVYSGG